MRIKENITDLDLMRIKDNITDLKGNYPQALFEKTKSIMI